MMEGFVLFMCCLIYFGIIAASHLEDRRSREVGPDPNDPLDPMFEAEPDYMGTTEWEGRKPCQH